MRSTGPMKTAKAGYIVSSILFIIFGLLFLIFPDISESVIVSVIGCAMILFGIIRIIGYFSGDLYRLAFQYDLAFGILLIALGIMVVTRPDKVMSFICIALGIAVLADGLFKVQIAIDSKRFGIGKWWLILIMSLLTSCIGLLMIFNPADSALFLFRITGIALITDGIMSIVTVLLTVKIIGHQRWDTD